MRVIVFGATGNVGTSVLQSLEGESGVDEIVAVARRAANREFARTTFEKADIASSDLAPLMRGADGRSLVLTRRQIDIVVKAARNAMFSNPTAAGEP